MRKRPCCTQFFTCIILLLQFFCTTGDIAGVETTNGYTVVATSEDVEGTASPYSSVFVCDTGYIPFVDSGFGRVTSVNESGTYRLKAQPGRYNVMVISSDAGYAGFVQAAVSADPPPQEHRTDLLYMKESGSLNAHVTSATGYNLLVYLAGTCFHRELQGTGSIGFSALAEGGYKLRVARISSSGNDGFTILLDTLVNVSPGIRTRVGPIQVE